MSWIAQRREVFDRDEAVAKCAELVLEHQTNYAVMPREIGGSNGLY